MDRRYFVQTFGQGLLLPSLAGLSGPLLGKVAPWEELWLKMIRDNDRRVATLLEQQEKAPDHFYRGGLPNEYGIHTAGGTASLIQSLAVSYVTQESGYYQRAALPEAMLDAVRCLLRMQHEDGTIDLHSTNFHSTPDTGFVVEPLALAYTILKPTGNLTLLDLLQQFLLRAGEALAVGGIHTPNHRWVVSMALSRIHAIFPNQRYLKRIDEWLHEKIDVDPDGQFTEQSTHVYSPLTDRCLITIARQLDRPELYEPVRRNLEMTLYYMHANGELVTEASGRQDQYTIGRMDPYYYAYRYMALLDENPRFSAMARMIEETAGVDQLSGRLPYFLEDRDLQKELPSPGPLPEDYLRSFPYSDLVRIRRREADATILAKNSTFFTFFKGGAALQAVRLASAFFGKGQFMADSMQEIDGAYVLRQELNGPYFQPYPVGELPEDGDWEKMPRDRRPQSEVQYLRSTVKIKETERGKFALTFDIQGADRVPLAVELGFRPGGELSGVVKAPGIDDAWLLKEGKGRYRLEGRTIEFGPGHYAHGWTQLRGAKPKLNALSVYLTGFTPFQFTLEVG